MTQYNTLNVKFSNLQLSKQRPQNLKIIKSLEESGLLMKTVREKIKNKAKKQKEGFFSMFLDTLGAG